MSFFAAMRMKRERKVILGKAGIAVVS